MHADGAVVLGIRRHLERRVTGQIHVRCIAGDQQMPFCIVAAGFPHQIHKGLVQLVEQAESLFLVSHIAVAVPGVFINALLVEGFKDQLVAVVGKFRSHLLPYGFVFFQRAVMVFIRLGDPATIPVDVDNGVHIVVQYIAGDLLDPGDEGGVDGVILCHHVAPRHRDPDGFESGTGNAVDHFIVFHGGAGNPAAACLQRVPQIPAHTHFLDHLGGGDIPHTAGSVVFAAGNRRSTAQSSQQQGDPFDLFHIVSFL